VAIKHWGRELVSTVSPSWLRRCKQAFKSRLQRIVIAVRDPDLRFHQLPLTDLHIVMATLSTLAHRPQRALYFAPALSRSNKVSVIIADRDASHPADHIAYVYCNTMQAWKDLQANRAHGFEAMFSADMWRSTPSY
jgi:hypothetical protein